MTPHPHFRRRLPYRRASEIAVFEHEGRRNRATLSRFETGEFAEVFLDAGKPDSTIQLNADDCAVLASLLLQHGISPSTIRRSIVRPIAVALARFEEKQP